MHVPRDEKRESRIQDTEEWERPPSPPVAYGAHDCNPPMPKAIPGRTTAARCARSTGSQGMLGSTQNAAVLPAGRESWRLRGQKIATTRAVPPPARGDGMAGC